MRERQSLILDADDTLWENNIYFESAFDEFVDFLRHSSLTARQVRDVLDGIEAVNARVHGYGSLNFGRNLQQTYRHLCEREINQCDLATVMSFAERILEQPLKLIDGVTETLDYLASRHDLTLMTKGHHEEQKLKLDRSGLGVYFGHTAIVREKDESAYIALIASRGMRPEATWMIGNSPRSDINPALGAGISAVYIPHPRTWILEKEEIHPSAGARLIQIEKFSDLRKHF